MNAVALRDESKSDSMPKKVDVTNWPVETGRYEVFDAKSCVAVCTLSNVDITLPKNIAIGGKCVIENIGIEKIVKNIIANPNIRFLLMCGLEPKGHFVGQAFLSLKQNGIDGEKRIIGARGAMPFLKNLSHEQVECFRKQVEIVDMIESENAGAIAKRVDELIIKDPGAFEEANGKDTSHDDSIKTIEASYDAAKEATADNSLDDSFFGISIDKSRKQIVVEHYIRSGRGFSGGVLKHSIAGNSAEEIAGTIVKLGLVKGLYHATYLGKELEKAEIALRLGKDYEQEKELVF